MDTHLVLAFFIQVTIWRLLELPPGLVRCTPSSQIYAHKILIAWCGIQTLYSQHWSFLLIFIYQTLPKSGTAASEAFAFPIPLPAPQSTRAFCPRLDKVYQASGQSDSLLQRRVIVAPTEIAVHALANFFATQNQGQDDGRHLAAS